MCCRTIFFCCTHDLRKRIIIAEIIDIILLRVLMALNIVLQGDYLLLLFLVVIIADILLVIGSYGNTSGLLMFWMIIGMINIVFLFIGWIGIPIYGFVAVFATALCKSSEVNVNCGSTENYTIVVFVINLIFIVGLPIYYIYLRVVVRSHR